MSEEERRSPSPEDRKRRRSEASESSPPPSSRRKTSHDDDVIPPPAAESSKVTSAIEATESRSSRLVNDGQLKARNQRMFGLLKGTLLRFQEETTKESVLKTRQDIEKQTEERLEEERRQIREERLKEKMERMAELRRKTEDEIKAREEAYMEFIAAAWKANEVLLAEYLHTETKPKIYYLPANHTQASRAQLEKQRTEALARLESKEKAEERGSVKEVEVK